VRLSKNPATSADAIGMLEAVKTGRLAGIYCVNWEKPAKRALRFGKSWWTVVPPSEDAVLMLDPENPLGGEPLIGFRRELDPRPKEGCDRLPNEKPLPPSPARLDTALLKAWASYRLWQVGQLATCNMRSSSQPVHNVVPIGFCQAQIPIPPDAGPSTQNGLGKRILIPFWVIAHRKNDLRDVEGALKGGANALECDVRWQVNRFVIRHDPWFTDQPFDFVKWLKGVRVLAGNYPRLSLVIFDYKDPQEGRVDAMLRQIREHLTSEKDAVPINVVISVGTWDGRGALEVVFEDLASHEGVAIDQNVTPQQTSQYFDSRFNQLRVRNRNQAYGNGIFMAGLEGSRRKQVMDAVALKARDRKIKFVYVWTLGARESVAEYLRIGVDGAFVNNPQTAVDVLNQAQFRDRYRLARREDRTFQPPRIPAYVLTVKTGNRLYAGTDANIEFRLIGERGHESTSRVNAFKPELFERNSVNAVTLRGKEIGQPTQLCVSHDGSGNAPEWFLETVHARKGGDSKLHTFLFNRWIEGRKSMCVKRALHRLAATARPF
jgi:glycerophosphoryl diester phosphodiesterase